MGWSWENELRYLRLISFDHQRISNRSWHGLLLIRTWRSLAWCPHGSWDGCGRKDWQFWRSKMLWEMLGTWGLIGYCFSFKACSVHLCISNCRTGCFQSCDTINQSSMAWAYMKVSWNRGTPKLSTSRGFSVTNHPFVGYPHGYRNPHISRWIMWHPNPNSASPRYRKMFRVKTTHSCSNSRHSVVCRTNDHHEWWVVQL